MKRTVAFGEVLLGLSPPGNERFMQSPALALKHTIPGDYNRVSAAEVDRLATGEASLQR